VAAPQRFSRERRLTQASEFARVFADPQRSSDRLFTVVARDNDGKGPRLGLAISKRAARRAVERNRLKRVAREVFRLQQQLPSSDFVVLAGIAAREASRTELRLSLEKHFQRLSQRRGSADHG
jgi:ribonuclease P protein component